MNTPNELDSLDLGSVVAGMDKQATPAPEAAQPAATPAANGAAPNGATPPRSGFVASVVAWKRRVGMPVFIQGY